MKGSLMGYWQHIFWSNETRIDALVQRGAVYLVMGSASNTTASAWW